jgi:hypothetical protein
MSQHLEQRIAQLERQLQEVRRLLASHPARIAPVRASSSIDPGPDYWVWMTVTGVERWDIPRFVDTVGS